MRQNYQKMIRFFSILSLMFCITGNFSSALGEGNDNHTVLLIHSDSYDGDTSFDDSSVSGGHSISIVGTPHHSTDITPKFGTSSIYFDGDNDYLKIPVSTGLNFGQGDFTVDFWLYPTRYSNVSEQYLGFNAYNQFDIVRIRSGLRQGTIEFRINGAIYTTTYAPTTINAWMHVAAVRQGSSVKLYIGGQLVDTITISGSLDITPAGSVDYITIGRNTPTGNAELKGYLDEIRISKGIARWTSNFKPPTEPYDSSSANLLPVAHAGTDQEVTDSVYLDGSGSYDPDGTIESYEWQFIHTENADYNRCASGVSPIVAYLEPGTYTVTLTVTDNCGGISTDTITLVADNTLYYSDWCVGQYYSIPADSRTSNWDATIDELTTEPTTIDFSDLLPANVKRVRLCVFARGKSNNLGKIFLKLRPFASTSISNAQVGKALMMTGLSSASEFESEIEVDVVDGKFEIFDQSNWDVGMVRIALRGFYK